MKNGEKNKKINEIKKGKKKYIVKWLRGHILSLVGTTWDFFVKHTRSDSKIASTRVQLADIYI